MTSLNNEFQRSLTSIFFFIFFFSLFLFFFLLLFSLHKARDTHIASNENDHRWKWNIFFFFAFAPTVRENGTPEADDHFPRVSPLSIVACWKRKRQIDRIFLKEKRKTKKDKRQTVKNKKYKIIQKLLREENKLIVNVTNRYNIIYFIEHNKSHKLLLEKNKRNKNSTSIRNNGYTININQSIRSIRKLKNYIPCVWLCVYLYSKVILSLE